MLNLSAGHDVERQVKQLSEVGAHVDSSAGYCHHERIGVTILHQTLAKQESSMSSVLKDSFLRYNHRSNKKIVPCRNVNSCAACGYHWRCSASKKNGSMNLSLIT